MPADKVDLQFSKAAERFTDLRAVRSGLLRGDRLIKRQGKWLSPPRDATAEEHSKWEFHTAVARITKNQKAKQAASWTLSREEWLKLCHAQSTANVDAGARDLFGAARRIQQGQEFKTACFPELITAAEQAEQEMWRIEAARQFEQERRDDERRQWESEQQLLEDGGWHQRNRNLMVDRDALATAPAWASAFDEFDKESYGSMPEIPTQLPLPISLYGDAPTSVTSRRARTRGAPKLADFD